MTMQKTVSEHEVRMKKAFDFLHDELRTVRTGRASTGLVEPIRVEYYGNLTPLKQLATISAPQADQIIIKPFDPASIKDIEKAIKNSDLSISPVVDGKMIRLTIPPLSEDRRKQLANQVKHLGEQAKVSIRNLRRDAIKELEDAEKGGTITEDDLEKGKKQMDNLTKEFVDKVDAAVKAKSAEIMAD